DLILMDMQMPRMDGVEATEVIRNQLDLDVHPLILAMTANASMEDRKKCLDAGMNDFITKPIKLNDLREHLYRWLKPLEAHLDSLLQVKP
ncbi:MAG: response regulator, partial [Bacteroidota bacterium]